MLGRATTRGEGLQLVPIANPRVPKTPESPPEGAQHRLGWLNNSPRGQGAAHTGSRKGSPPVMCWEWKALGTETTTLKRGLNR